MKLKTQNDSIETMKLCTERIKNEAHFIVFLLYILKIEKRKINNPNIYPPPDPNKITSYSKATKNENKNHQNRKRNI